MEDIRELICLGHKISEVKTGLGKKLQTYNRIKKDKAIPLQPWRGPRGSRNLRLPDLKTIGT